MRDVQREEIIEKFIFLHLFHSIKDFERVVMIRLMCDSSAFMGQCFINPGGKIVSTHKPCNALLIELLSDRDTSYYTRGWSLNYHSVVKVLNCGQFGPLCAFLYWPKMVKNSPN